MRTKLIAILVMLLSSSALSFIDSGSDISEAAYLPLRFDVFRNFISLGGTEIVEKVANLRIIGEDVPQVGGALGAYTWIGDVDGDGLNDLAIAAPMTLGFRGHAEDGTIYIFYGSDGPLTGTIDLGTYTPDLKIIGDSDGSSRGGLALTSQMTCGDYNDDGFIDIAICLPTTSNGSWGYILFGRAEGWGQEIKLPEDADLYNGVFLYYCGPYSTSMDAQTPYFMSTEDVDQDGIDDLVYGGHFDDFYHPRRWNVTIAWGGFTDSGNGAHVPAITYTALEDRNSLSNFASSVDTGDIDGDGWTDMVVGAPLKTPLSTDLEQSGEVIVYFNISSLKGTELIRWDSVPHKTIEGSDAYDRFGYSVEVSDIDGDGKHDIICSAPYADGPSDADPDCGEVMIFGGGPNTSFPDVMDAESGFDLMVIGPAGSGSGDGARLGQMFRLGDVTGDGELDLVVGMKDKDLVPIGSDLRLKAGIVMVYDHMSVFGQGQPVVRLGYPSKLFTLEATDIEDGFGYHLSVGDIDNNGIDDIVASAPNADGEGNARPRCGEAYVIYSSHMRLWDQHLSGSSYSKGTVFSSQGPLTVETEIMNLRPEVPIDRVRFEIGPSYGPIVFNCSASGTDLTDPYGCIDPESVSVVMPEQAPTTSLRVTFEIGWFYPLRDKNDVRIVLKDAEGCILTRTYHDVFKVGKDLSFGKELRIGSGGEELPGQGAWLGMGDPVEIGGIPVVFRDRPEREVEDGDVDLIISSSAGEATVPYTSGWRFEDIVRDSPEQAYSIRMRIADGPVPVDPGLMPVLESDRRIAVNVDAQPPEMPTVSELTPPEGSVGAYGKPGSWDLEIGGSLGEAGDAGGSGVRYFIVEDATGSFYSMEKGGLFGTYYSDLEFGSVALNVTDPSVDFDWGPWGPHPETYSIPPYGFSARWHGWISSSADATVRFQLAGRGLGMMVLDGDVHIPYDDLEYAPKGSVLTLEEDALHSVVLYYRHAGTNETPSFRFQWIDPNGTLVPVPGSALSYPSTRTHVTISETSRAISVRSVDWVGLMSMKNAADADIDPFTPVFDTSMVPRWTRTLNPSFDLTLTDVGSGIDPGSMVYRLLRDGETFGSWTSDGIAYTVIGGGNSIIDITAMVPLERDFSGTIEFMASDRAGNVGRTGALPLGHDRKAPTIIVLDPDPSSVVRTANLTLTVLATDINGSGVDPNALVLRYRLNGLEWRDAPSSGTGLPTEVRRSFDIDAVDGILDLELTAEDAVGNRGVLQLNLTVQIPPVNQPPVVMIGEPLNGTRSYWGYPLILDATGTSDDGLGLYDPIRLLWFSNVTGYLGSGMSIKVNLPAGIHRIYLFADDGEYNVSTSVTVLVTVRGDGGGGGGEEPPSTTNGVIELLIAIFIVILLIGITVLVLLVRHRYVSSGPIDEE